jgi:hypothetical protein
VSCDWALQLMHWRHWPGDEEARIRGTQKSVLERKAPPTFPLVIEMRERAHWVTHWTEDSVDCLLHNKVPIVQVILYPLPPPPGGGPHATPPDCWNAHLATPKLMNSGSCPNVSARCARGPELLVVPRGLAVDWQVQSM